MIRAAAQPPAPADLGAPLGAGLLTSCGAASVHPPRLAKSTVELSGLDAASPEAGQPRRQPASACARALSAPGALAAPAEAAEIWRARWRFMEAMLARADRLRAAGTFGRIEVRGSPAAGPDRAPQVAIEQVDCYRRAIGDFLLLRAAAGRSRPAGPLGQESAAAREDVAAAGAARALRHLCAAEQCFVVLKHARTVGEPPSWAARGGPAMLGWPELQPYLGRETASIARATAAFDRQAAAERRHPTAVWIAWSAGRQLDAAEMHAALATAPATNA